MEPQPITVEQFKESCERYGSSTHCNIRYLDPVAPEWKGEDVVPSSECAMHCRYAGHRVQIVAIFERDIPQSDGKIWHSRYAYALLDNGLFAHGLVGEIVPWSIRRQHSLN